MAKLHFKYGAMNSGKTTFLIQSAHNYEANGYKVLVLKSSLDTKGDDYIVNRIGLKRKIDEYIYPNEKIIPKIKKYLKNLACIFVDEAQFLNADQAEELLIIAKAYDIPVIAYGLRTQFNMKGFTGSPTLLLIADELEEIPTICKCGKKARFNARKYNGEFQNSEGERIVIDGEEGYEYVPLCGECYVKEVLKITK